MNPNPAHMGNSLLAASCRSSPDFVAVVAAAVDADAVVDAVVVAVLREHETTS